MPRTIRGRSRFVRAPQKRTARTPEARLEGLFEYAAFMEEPLDRALDLTRGLVLAADGLVANHHEDNGRPVRVLGGLISSQVHTAKSMLLTLLKAAGEGVRESAPKGTKSTRRR